MNELQIIRLENTDISGWDFATLRAELQSRLDFYANLVYTDDTIKDAKKDRTTLNKVKKVIEDARKAYKARCLAPYDALEPDMKSLVDMVEKQRTLIDDTVKEYEARQKEAKEQEIKKFYDRKAIVLGDLAERLYLHVCAALILNAEIGASAVAGVAAHEAGGSSLHFKNVGAHHVAGIGCDLCAVRQHTAFFLDFIHSLKPPDSLR